MQKLFKILSIILTLQASMHAMNDQCQSQAKTKARLSRLGAVSGLPALYHSRSYALRRNASISSCATQSAASCASPIKDVSSSSASCARSMPSNLLQQKKDDEEKDPTIRAIKQNITHSKLQQYVGSFHTTPASKLIEQNKKELLPLIIAQSSDGKSLPYYSIPEIEKALKYINKTLAVHTYDQTLRASANSYIPVIIALVGPTGELTVNGGNHYRPTYNALPTVETTDPTDFLWRNHNNHLDPLTNDQFFVALFSDGSIKWYVNSYNEKKLKNLLSVDQIKFAVELFNTKPELVEYLGFAGRKIYSFDKPVIINAQQQEVYNTIEPAIRKKLMINYPHMQFSEKKAKEYEKSHTSEGRKKSVKSYGKALAYPCITGLVSTCLVFTILKTIDTDKRESNSKLFEFSRSFGVAISTLDACTQHAENIKNKYNRFTTIAFASGLGAFVYWIIKIK